MKFDQVEKVEVNLTSATLRINLDTKDDISEDALEDVLNKRKYDKVNAIFTD